MIYKSELSVLSNNLLNKNICFISILFYFSIKTKKLSKSNYMN